MTVESDSRLELPRDEPDAEELESTRADDDDRWLEDERWVEWDED